MTNLTPSEPESLPVSATEIAFYEVMDIVGKSIAKSSQRIYSQTLHAWCDWCDVNNINYFDLKPQFVYQFLDEGETTLATRNRQLSALRKLAQVMTVVGYEDAQQLYAGLKILKAPKPNVEDVTGKERNKRALSPAEADKILRVWSTLPSPIHIRNHLMIRLLLFTGLRRSELAVLQWRDLDLERGIIHVRLGKGDKDRDVAILDNTDNTNTALHTWRDIQGDGREFVFCSVNKGGRLGPDKPIHPDTVWQVVKKTAKQANLPDFATHDLRRTHITEYLTTGGSLANAQSQAGHADGSTTLKYAQSVDAEKRHGEVKFRFGA